MVFRWARPHVGVEVSEIHPALTDFDSTPTVQFPDARLSAGATAFHSAPDFIFGCVAHSVLFLLATAASGVSHAVAQKIIKAARRHRYLVAAIACAAAKFLSRCFSIF